METTNMRPWLCHSCGYMEDTVTALLDEHRAPVSGDLTLCLNCSALAKLDGDRWRPLHTDEFAAMSAAERRILTNAQQALRAARRAFGVPNLADRDHRA